MFVSPDTLALLAKLGVSGTDAVDVIRAFETDMQAQTMPRRSTSAERMARKRERDAVASQSVTCDAGSDARGDAQCDAKPLPQGSVSPTPPSTPNPNPSPPYSPPASLRKQARMADFEAFWLAYPRKVAKGSAESAWAKTAKERPPVAELVAAVQRYVRAKPADIDFCHPATWLNGKRWLDQHGSSTRAEPVEIAATWTGPAELRAFAVRERGEGFAKNYLDPATWDGEAIRPRTRTAAAELRRVFRDVTILEPQGAAA